MVGLLAQISSIFLRLHLPARSANLPEGLYILLALISSFYFLIFF